MNKLYSIEDCENWLNDGEPTTEDGIIVNILVKQLLDTMRENERLRSVIETCDCGAAEALSCKDTLPNCSGIHYAEKYTAQPTQNSDVCVQCGKPVDRLKAYSVRLNNWGKPNDDTDKWGYQHIECATPEQLVELGL